MNWTYLGIVLLATLRNVIAQQQGYDYPTPNRPFNAAQGSNPPGGEFPTQGYPSGPTGPGSSSTQGPSGSGLTRYPGSSRPTEQYPSSGSTKGYPGQSTVTEYPRTGTTPSSGQYPGQQVDYSGGSKDIPRPGTGSQQNGYPAASRPSQSPGAYSTSGQVSGLSEKSTNGYSNGPSSQRPSGYEEQTGTTGPGAAQGGYQGRNFQNGPSGDFQGGPGVSQGRYNGQGGQGPAQNGFSVQSGQDSSQGPFSGQPGQGTGKPGQGASQGGFTQQPGQESSQGFDSQQPQRGFPSHDSDGQVDDGDYSAIPGEPDKDYPIFSFVPDTSFRCDQQQYPGYYADVEARCQVFHICANNKTYDFLCPNGTVFHQEYLVCVWWNQFDCDSAPSLFGINANIYDYSITGSQQTGGIPVNGNKSNFPTGSRQEPGTTGSDYSTGGSASPNYSPIQNGRQQGPEYPSSPAPGTSGVRQNGYPSSGKGAEFPSAEQDTGYQTDRPQGTRQGFTSSTQPSNGYSRGPQGPASQQPNGYPSGRQGSSFPAGGQDTARSDNGGYTGVGQKSNGYPSGSKLSPNFPGGTQSSTPSGPKTSGYQFGPGPTHPSGRPSGSEEFQQSDTTYPRPGSKNGYQNGITKQPDFSEAQKPGDARFTGYPSGRPAGPAFSSSPTPSQQSNTGYPGEGSQDGYQNGVTLRPSFSGSQKPSPGSSRQSDTGYPGQGRQNGYNSGVIQRPGSSEVQRPGEAGPTGYPSDRPQGGAFPSGPRESQQSRTDYTNQGPTNGYKNGGAQRPGFSGKQEDSGLGGYPSQGSQNGYQNGVKQRPSFSETQRPSEVSPTGYPSGRPQGPAFPSGPGKSQQSSTGDTDQGSQTGYQNGIIQRPSFSSSQRLEGGRSTGYPSSRPQSPGKPLQSNPGYTNQGSNNGFQNGITQRPGFSSSQGPEGVSSTGYPSSRPQGPGESPQSDIGYTNQGLKNGYQNGVTQRPGFSGAQRPGTGYPSNKPQGPTSGTGKSLQSDTEYPSQFTQNGYQNGKTERPGFSGAQGSYSTGRPNGEKSQGYPSGRPQGPQFPPIGSDDSRFSSTSSPNNLTPGSGYQNGGPSSAFPGTGSTQQPTREYLPPYQN